MRSAPKHGYHDRGLIGVNLEIRSCHTVKDPRYLRWSTVQARFCGELRAEVSRGFRLRIGLVERKITGQEIDPKLQLEGF